ncbi:MAG: sigma-70 family RNA polymerase sigma factor [Acidobacteria bacterium]|nr:sigma-70 family RNA polymerase sigma factor [Acidobacteriota bacterium]
MSMDERPAPGEVTQLLQDWRQGREEAGGEIISLLYRELERMASSYLRNERGGHTLEPAGLVSELYLRMMKGAVVPYQDRAHFFAVAARQLRRILVDYARKRKGRGEERFFVTLSGLESSAAGMKAEDIEALEEAMTELEKLDDRAHKVVELRFFAGLKEDEVAELLGLSRTTMKRDWAFARAFLISRMGTTGEGQLPG